MLGPEAAAALLPVDGVRDALRLTGLACAPTETRATARAQFLVVNGRPVADPALRTAVRVAYRDVIAAGRHPVVALYLTIPPDELDVNVHPAKAELRFRDPAARPRAGDRQPRIGRWPAGQGAPPRISPPGRTVTAPVHLVPPARPSTRSFAEAQLGFDGIRPRGAHPAAASAGRGGRGRHLPARRRRGPGARHLRDRRRRRWQPGAGRPARRP